MNQKGAKRKLRHASQRDQVMPKYCSVVVIARVTKRAAISWVVAAALFVCVCVRVCPPPMIFSKKGNGNRNWQKRREGKAAAAAAAAAVDGGMG